MLVVLGLRKFRQKGQKAWPHHLNVNRSRLLLHACGMLLAHNYHHIPSQDRDTLLSSIRISYRNRDILRNISKRQYVRRSTLLKMCKACPKRWKISSVDLGHVVISRVCWSSDGSISMAYDGGIRGVWAGDHTVLISPLRMQSMKMVNKLNGRTSQKRCSMKSRTFGLVNTVCMDSSFLLCRTNV